MAGDLEDKGDKKQLSLRIEGKFKDLFIEAKEITKVSDADIVRQGLRDILPRIIKEKAIRIKPLPFE